MKFLLTFLVLSYILLSGVLRLSGSGALESTSDRIVGADIIGIVLILISFFLIIKRNKFFIPKVFRSYLPLIFIFILSGTFSYAPDRALIEILATMLGFMISVAMLNILINLDEVTLRRFFYRYFIIMGGFFLFFVCDFLFLNIVSRPIGGLTGTFRNTGQAGAFIGTHLAIMIPLVLSRIIKKDIWVYLSLFFSLLALILTFKRAAILGFSVGIILLLIILLFSKNIKDKRLSMWLFIVSFFISWALLIAFNWGLVNVEGMMGRWDSKFSSDTINDFEEGFLADNIKVTINSFFQSPVIGIGLGNVETTDFAHEIHSTYMSIIATSGLFGIIAYLFFIYSYTKVVLNNFFIKNKNEYNQFFYYFLPFYLGLLVSWGYTYHLRKREFWILISLTLLVSHVGKKIKNKDCF